MTSLRALPPALLTRGRSLLLPRASIPSRAFSDDGVKIVRKRSRRRQRPQAAPLSEEEWAASADAYLSQIVAGFGEAVQVNPGASIVKDDEGYHIDFGEQRGALSLSANRDDRTIEVISPISGALKYSYEAESRTWLHVIDKHDMRGILVRDFLRAGCVGLPNV